MPEKKRIAVVKTAEQSIDKRMTKPQAPKTIKSSDAAQSQSSAAAAAAPALNGHTQLAAFEAAMKQFHTRNFADARELFQHATQGPERDIAQRAGLHIAMCDRRLQQETPPLASAEEYYTYGVAMMNARKLSDARASLEKAVNLDPRADHMLYALAGALALSGEFHGAYDSLKKAIEMEPRNRLAARQDPDFAPLANQPPFDTLLYPEKKSW